MAFANVLNSCMFITVALLLIGGATVTLSQGFNYGDGAGDSLLSASDGGSVKVVVSTPFVFYGKSETDVFVSHA